ncbi:MAG: NADP-dependent malic enzyme [Clostridiales Family XIII bacterium]|nr:NADP-dependent malic enzyme [Clostridiales Family XIII bacterium]
MAKDYYEESLRLHELYSGKLAVVSKVNLDDTDDLSTAYTPGVAQPCREIVKNPDSAYRYTFKGNAIAVVSDGSATLGLGNTGGLASLPVMEGKCVLFKRFANVDAFPIVLATQDADEIVETVARISPTFGGINLEDISAPRCFEIESRLRDELGIPVFHDDQHGTAIVVSAAVINAFKLLGKPLGEVKAVVNGAGAAGNAITKMLAKAGVKDIIVCDSKGIIHSGRMAELSKDKIELLELTNKENKKGRLKTAIKGRDLFIGVSAPKVVTKEMVGTMVPDPVVFALSNPEPEIRPKLAKEGGAKIVATGRSDFPNQINNVLAFPGVFRGALDAEAKDITDGMKIAAAYALAGLIQDDELTAEKIIPRVFDEGVVQAVAGAVAKAWKENA